MAKVPFADPFDHLVYLRVVEACDLACAHCFIPANPKRMDLDAVAMTAERLRPVVAPGSRVLVQWHGGEPTLVGAAWMDGAVARLEEAGPDLAWSHGIQTNLMSYSREWADVYRRRFGGRVGVSWDPAIRLTRTGVMASNAEFEARFWPALDALLDDGLDPYLVVTGTKVFFDLYRNPMDFFDLLESRGVRHGHVERVTRTGTARRNWDWLGVSNAQWSEGMSRFLRAYVLWRERDPTRRLHLSPFDGALESAGALASGTARRGAGCLSDACDTRFHTIDQRGYKRGCTALTSETDNVRADPTSALRVPDPVAARSERQIFNCNSCRFRPVCSSGCLALDFDDGSGECSGGKGFLEAALSMAKRLAARDQERSSCT